MSALPSLLGRFVLLFQLGLRKVWSLFVTVFSDFILSLLQLFQVVGFSVHDHLVNRRYPVSFWSQLQSLEIKLPFGFFHINILRLETILSLESVGLMFFSANYLFDLCENLYDCESHVVP